VALGAERAGMAGDDAGGLLPPVLQGVKAKRGKRGGRGVPVNAEDAAPVPEAVDDPPGVQLDAPSFGVITVRSGPSFR